MIKYELLDPINLTDANRICCLSMPELVHLDDPAQSVMVTVPNLLSYIIRPGAHLDRASTIMKHAEIAFLLVMKSDGEIVGAVSKQDVNGEKPYQLMRETREALDELQINAVMIPFSEFISLSLSSVKTARVGNLVATLKNAHKEYALVIDDSDASNPQLAGVLSLHQIAKQLHKNIEETLEGAQSLSELQHRHS